MTFEWGIFGPLALRSLEESTARINVWHGSVRSGKTVTSLVRWMEFVRTAPPGDLLMAGKTERTLKRNILDPLAEMVGGRAFRYRAGSGEARLFGRRIYVAGANDERAEGKIRGLTLAGAYGDEIALWPESFFRMLLSRLSVRGAKFFGTSNPDGPYHWLKREFLDRTAELDLRHWSFGLDDNPNLDAAYVEALKREYTGLWYRRYVLGQWVAAEGVVYDMFDEHVHVVDTPLACDRWYLGVDYGTANPCVFLLIGERTGEDGRRQLYVHDEYYYDGRTSGRQRTDAEYSRDLASFLTRHQVAPRAVVVDPSALSFITQLRRDGIPVVEADNDVLPGIRSVATMLAQRRLFVNRACKHLIGEMQTYSWDATAQKRGEDKPLKQHDHAPDALRYVAYRLERDPAEQLMRYYQQSARGA
ncbi:MAG: PBSX family phage terminase large subunit [Sphaerobacter sp.]|nr:PBSX family phage terminase large subunit [Sphaerobacter sp.]